MQPKRWLAASLVAAVIAVAVDEARAGDWPPPEQFVALWLVWEILSLVSEVGPEAARFAGLFSGLVLAGILVRKGGGLVAALQTLYGRGAGELEAGALELRRSA